MRESKLTKLGRLMGHYEDGEQRSDGVSIPHDCNDFSTFIPAPVRPVEPVYESEDLPDLNHSWAEYTDDGEPGHCANCGWGSAYVLGKPNCAREAARIRNTQLRNAWLRSLPKYEAQMEYYNSVIVPLGEQ
ncbi:hypothetical protein DDJ40_08050 [Mycobacteroides abscessus]|nr:hypothetical protein DDJ40_08050 [Mycobacteroides abscessus]